MNEYLLRTVLDQITFPVIVAPPTLGALADKVLRRSGKRKEQEASGVLLTVTVCPVSG